jgi:hypothetical protein
MFKKGFPKMYNKAAGCVVMGNPARMIRYT